MNRFARACLPIVALLGTQIAGAQGGVSLTAEDPRPVAKAIGMLVARYGSVITYEDPPYVYAGDIQDVTNQVRKDLDKYPSGKAPKVMIPRGGKLTFSLASTASADAVQDLRPSLDRLVRMGRETGGHFRVLESGGAFHVIPTQVRNAEGNWADTASILDRPISIPTRDRTQFELLSDFCNAVTSAGHIEVKLGLAGSTGIGADARYSFGANNEVARDVLMRVLATIPLKTKTTWVLFYSVSDKAYYLSFLAVPNLGPKVQAPPVADMQPATVPRTPSQGREPDSARTLIPESPRR